MRPILAGIETEYGFTVEDRPVSFQTEDSEALVRAYPGLCWEGWDYSSESPRKDLRGWTEKSLSVDPVDAEFDRGSSSADRADRVLPNGARFYNDHGHPEYATPECWTCRELALHDLAGQEVVIAAAKTLSERLGKQVCVYKNNTDFHGASYGTHESYLIPRKYSFEVIYKAVMPMLVARQVLTGAGKVGSEARGPVQFQISQRADFFTTDASIDTLYRRPVFNTRDEPHADGFIRLHVISGDANMMPSCTARKVGLVKIAIACMEMGVSPNWSIPDPVRSFQLTSRDPDGEGRIELDDRNWTTPRAVLESYLDALEPLVKAGELLELIQECRALLEARHSSPDTFRREVDWAAKYWMINEFREAEDLRWHDKHLQSLDLAYPLLDPEEGLYYALAESGETEMISPLDYIDLVSRPPSSRALARGSLVRVASKAIEGISWGKIRLKHSAQPIHLPPDREYPEELRSVENLEQWLNFVQD